MGKQFSPFSRRQVFDAAMASLKTIRRAVFWESAPFVGDNSAESSYYTWVDQHDVLGLGRDVPISTGNLNDGLIAFVDGEMVRLRVPYPLGFYAKGLDGRIDDPDAGWKGRGVWTSSGDRTPWLREGGKGSRPLAVHFQVRPDPLAK